MIPDTFARVVCDHWRRADRDGDPPSAEELKMLVLALTEELRDATLDHVANALDAHYAKYERRFETPAALNSAAREIVGSVWKSLEGRLRYVPGKRLLARCRDEVKTRYYSSLTDGEIVEFAREDELMPLIKIIRLCEDLKP